MCLCVYLLLTRLNDSVFIIVSFFSSFRKGMFGLKLKKKRNKAEKGLILANKAAKGEAGGGALTTEAERTSA